MHLTQLTEERSSVLTRSTSLAGVQFPARLVQQGLWRGSSFLRCSRSTRSEERCGGGGLVFSTW